MGMYWEWYGVSVWGHIQLEGPGVEHIVQPSGHRNVRSHEPEARWVD